MCIIWRIVAYLCLNMINFDAVNFSERCSEKVISFFWNPVYFCASFNFVFFQPGDRVYVCKSGPGLPGTYAEYTLVEEKDVFHLPSNLDFKQGATLGVPYFTAYRALFQR